MSNTHNTPHTEEFNFVVGFILVGRNIVDGRAVINPQKSIRLQIDHTIPITLVRCAEIMQVARQLSGRPLAYISIRRSIYTVTPGNECSDWAEDCLMDKKWNYDSHTNSLEIFDRGEPVYANNNGSICRDQAALYDCLGD